CHLPWRQLNIFWLMLYVKRGKLIRKSSPTMTSRSSHSSARPQLSEKATAHIRGLIMSGELQPGTLVRPETIGEELDISTTPTREALQSLRVEGFLELVPRHGFVVAPLTGQDIRDLFQVQALIGGE